MKIIKKIILVFVLMIACMFTCVNTTNATTVTVNTSFLKMRQEASTSSEVVAMLSEGIECELIEESGDWYKVTYKSYTGYVSKEYVIVNDDTEEVNETDNTSNEEDNDEEEETEEAISTTSTGEISSDTKVRLTPLIYSTSIGTLEKNTEVTIITELNDWLYVQTNTIAGWVRSDSIILK